jgi:hypothetical protein
MTSSWTSPTTCASVPGIGSASRTSATPDRRLSGHVVGIDFSRFVKLSNIPNDPSNYRRYVKLSDVPNDYDVRYWRVVEIVFHPPFSPVFSSLSTGNPETLPP